MSLTADLTVFAVAVVAGLVGALAGVGGGTLVIPALTLGLGMDIRLAVGASIVSVIATSSGAAAAYVRDRMTDMRVGMFLELATTSGAVVGAILAAVVSRSVLYVLLGLVLLLSAAMQAIRLGEELPPPAPPRRSPPAFTWWEATPTRGWDERSPTRRGGSLLASSSWGSPASSRGSWASGRGPSRSWPWTWRCACP